MIRVTSPGVTYNSQEFVMVVIFSNLKTFSKVSYCLDFTAPQLGVWSPSRGRKLHGAGLAQTGSGDQGSWQEVALLTSGATERQRMNNRVKGHSQKCPAKLISKARRA